MTISRTMYPWDETDPIPGLDTCVDCGAALDPSDGRICASCQRDADESDAVFEGPEHEEKKA